MVGAIKATAAVIKDLTDTMAGATMATIAAILATTIAGGVTTTTMAFTTLIVIGCGAQTLTAGYGSANQWL